MPLVPADALVLRIPRIFTIILLVFTVLQLTGLVSHVMSERSLLAAFDLPWVVAVPEFAFFLAISFANDRFPPRLSARGVESRGTHIFRYDPVARWDQVERIWVGTQNLLLVRLHDPASFAGADARLPARMRRNRNRFSADLLIPLLLVKPGKAEIAEAVDRLSGGTHRLEHALIDPVPGADDVVLENRFVTPASLVLLIAMTAPWGVIIFRAAAAGSVEGRDLFVALLLTLVLLPPFLAAMAARVAPPIMALSGLRLRSGLRFTYDTFVPWSRVTQVRMSRTGPFPLILASVANPEELAGGNPRLGRRMRRNRHRFGADLVIPALGTTMDDARLADTHARLTS
jgi:hypothetical protein